ncbi:hypothetical protein F5H01DRAFT_364918 [Linnemannia elongata]|nr:hypothetical protein F5H01DRAFT_364918 [Linnemannia elongata]
MSLDSRQGHRDFDHDLLNTTGSFGSSEGADSLSVHLAHLDSFWLEWDREEASHEFDVSCETVTKRTAALAQQASLAISARGFSAVQANNSTAVHNLPTDADDDVKVAMVIDVDAENAVKIKNSVFVTYIDFYYMRLDEASSGKLQPAIPFSETKSSTSAIFTKKNRRSLEGRYHALGENWILASGTMVEDVLYTAGSDEDCASFSTGSDLEAFSHNPTDGSFKPLPAPKYQLSE